MIKEAILQVSRCSARLPVVTGCGPRIMRPPTPIATTVALGGEVPSQLTRDLLLAEGARAAIKKYVLANNKSLANSSAVFDAQFNKAIRSGVEKGEFHLPKGTSGTVKLAKKEPAAKKESDGVKKPAAAKKTAAKKEAPVKEAAPKKKVGAPKKATKDTATKKAPAAKKAGAKAKPTANTASKRKAPPA
ncbi:MAG: hypothetical protein L6R36_009478 [Xanthoria steineri]|nr:MAG: hypothetical protein L6R36_009478 [Xanthoria steineri]